MMMMLVLVIVVGAAAVHVSVWIVGGQWGGQWRWRWRCGLVQMMIERGRWRLWCVMQLCGWAVCDSRCRCHVAKRRRRRWRWWRRGWRVSRRHDRVRQRDTLVAAAAATVVFVVAAALHLHGDRVTLSIGVFSGGDGFIVDSVAFDRVIFVVIVVLIVIVVVVVVADVICVLVLLAAVAVVCHVVWLGRGCGLGHLVVRLLVHAAHVSVDGGEGWRRGRYGRSGRSRSVDRRASRVARLLLATALAVLGSSVLEPDLYLLWLARVQISQLKLKSNNNNNNNNECESELLVVRTGWASARARTCAWAWRTCCRGTLSRARCAAAPSRPCDTCPWCASCLFVVCLFEML